MPTQNVNLTDKQAEFIRQRVESGDYNNASEVVRDALRLLTTRQEEYETRLEALRTELQKGFDDIEAGRYIELNGAEDFDALSREIRRRGRERLAERARELSEEASSISTE